MMKVTYPKKREFKAGNTPMKNEFCANGIKRVSVFFKHYSYLRICFIICGFPEAFKIQSLLFYPIFISYIGRRSKRRILQKKERNKNLK